jgi:hypothetical protein
MATKPYTKPTKRSCKYKFTDAELLEIGQHLAEATENLEALKEEKKKVVSDFAAKISAAQADANVAVNQLRSGWEHREMACTIHFDVPAKNRKSYIRDDTGETVGNEPMDEHDRQAQLDFEKDEKTAKPKPVAAASSTPPPA